MAAKCARKKTKKCSTKKLSACEKQKRAARKRWKALTKCSGTNKAGKPCRGIAMANGRCYIHQ